MKLSGEIEHTSSDLAKPVKTYFYRDGMKCGG